MRELRTLNVRLGVISVTLLLLVGIGNNASLLAIPAFAQTASTTITTSADSNGGKFFGPALLEVLINVPSHASDTAQGTLPVTVTAFGASNTYQVTETGTTSGLFLLYVKVDPTAATAENPLEPATPFSAVNTRIYIGPAGVAATYPATSGTAPNQSVNAELAANPTKGGSIQIAANGVTKTITWDESTATLTLDRTAYGVANTIIAQIKDQDANLDPTKADTITEAAANTLLAAGGDAPDAAVSFTETGPNTGIFENAELTTAELPTGVDSAARSLTANDFQAFSEATNDAAITPNVIATSYATVETVGVKGTSAASYTVQNVKGQFQNVPTPTYATEPPVQANDSNQNTNSTSQQIETSVGGPIKITIPDMINEVTKGQQVVLNTSVKNNDDSQRPFVAIVEVRDADGITQMLQWQTGTMPANGNANIGVWWVPDNAGSYEVRAFVISALQNPQVLSDVITHNVTVS